MRGTIMMIMALCYSYAEGQLPARYSMVITEILPDPLPQQGLPSSEFIELKNKGSATINLRNWTVSSHSTTGRITADVLLEPDSIAILTVSSSLTAYRRFGRSVPLTPFPALSNSGDTLILRSPQGEVIHAMSWEKSLYANPVKANGGWSLELIDDGKPCVGTQNWTASISPAGGTPGKENSVRGQVTDKSPPYVKFVFAKDPQTLVMEWDEPVATGPGLFFFVDGVGINGIPQPPFFNQVFLVLPSPIRTGQWVSLDIPPVPDCQGNLSAPSQVRTGLFSAASAADLVINEILFNPPDDGADYLEIFNRSGKIIDLGSIYLFAKKANGVTGPPLPCSDQVHPIMPDSVKVLTKDKNWLSHTYATPLPAIISCDLPSLPDEEGGIVISNAVGQVIDELYYDELWHHPLLSNREGVALERINTSLPTQQKNNWQSASSLDHYGTPGRRNSQSALPINPNSPLTMSTRVISPDLDGVDDFLLMGFRFPTPGYLADIRVFNIAGHEVSIIARNELCGTSGQFLWFGLDKSGQPLPKGNYIIHARFFSVAGTSIALKHVIGIWK